MDMDPECEWYYSITLLNGNERYTTDGVIRQGDCVNRAQLIEKIVAGKRALGFPVRAVESHMLERNDL
jgi:hypothetical protein